MGSITAESPHEEGTCLCGGTVFKPEVAMAGRLRDYRFVSCTQCGLLYAGQGPKRDLHEYLQTTIARLGGEPTY